MIAILLIVYFSLIWLLFYKFKVVKPSVKSWTGAAIIGVFVIGWILLAMTLFQPYSTNAVVSRYVVQIAPQVTGLVKRVAVSPNVPVNKGDVLFQIEPALFEAKVQRLEAALVQAGQDAKALQDNLTSANARVVMAQAAVVSSEQQVGSLEATLAAARATVSETQAQLSLAEDEYKRVVAATEQDPGAISDIAVDAKRQTYIALQGALLVTQAQETSAQAAVDSVINGENTLVVQAKAQLREARAAESKAQLAVDSVIDGENTNVAEIRARLREAQLHLSWATIHAPADGFVSNLQLREGFVVRTGVAVMSFIDTSERYLIVPLAQSVVRHVQPGNPVDVALELYPGRIFSGSVESVIWASGEGQGDPSGNLPDVSAVQGGTQLAVRVTFDELPSDLQVPLGAGGAAAIYTEGGKPLRIIRKVIVRMYTWLNYL